MTTKAKNTRSQLDQQKRLRAHAAKRTLRHLSQGKEITTIRRVWQSPTKCRDEILQILSKHVISDDQLTGEGGWRIDGFLRTTRIAPRMPVHGARFSIMAEPNEGGTHIEIRAALTEEFLKWKDLVYSVLAALMMVGFLLGFFYIFSAVNFLNTGQGDLGNEMPAAIISLLVAVFLLALIIEVGRLSLIVRLNSFDPKLRRKLEAVCATATLNHQEAATGTSGIALEPKVRFLLTVLIPVQLVLVCAVLRFWPGAVVVLLVSLLALPLLLANYCGRVAKNLPFRYRLKARSLDFVATWHIFMSVPLLILPVDLIVPWAGSLGYAFFSALFALSIALGLPGMADKVLGACGGMLRNPSLGYEAVTPRVEDLAEFNRAAMVLFVWMAIVTYVQLAAAVVTLAWRTPVPAVILLNFPLVACLEAWVKRGFRALVLRFRSLPPGGGQTLDALVRPGIYEEVQSMLEAEVSCRVGRRIGFGAAISRSGLVRPRYLILIDKLTFSIIMDPRQREALIWHEVAHYMFPRREGLHEARFGMWAEHARFVLSDSLRDEMRCDEFVIQRGLGKELLQALEAIQLQTREAIHGSGAGSLRRTDEGILDGIRNYLRLVSGSTQPEEGHPHLEVRIKEVRERVAGSIV